MGCMHKFITLLTDVHEYLIQPSMHLYPLKYIHDSPLELHMAENSLKLIRMYIIYLLCEKVLLVYIDKGMHCICMPKQ